MTVGPLDAINRATREAAAAELLRLCGSRRWAESMADARPFADERALLAAADPAFQALTREDWLEAFRAHPRIGDLDALRTRFGHEQASVGRASDAVLEALARRNREYEARFGYLFIICATGKSAEEMLAALEARLPNSAEAELPLAADEQRKITRLRVEKLLRS